MIMSFFPPPAFQSPSWATYWQSLTEANWKGEVSPESQSKM